MNSVECCLPKSTCMTWLLHSAWSCSNTDGETQHDIQYWLDDHYLLIILYADFNVLMSSPDVSCIGWGGPLSPREHWLGCRSWSWCTVCVVYVWRRTLAERPVCTLCRSLRNCSKPHRWSLMTFKEIFASWGKTSMVWLSPLSVSLFKSSMDAGPKVRKVWWSSTFLLLETLKLLNTSSVALHIAFSLALVHLPLKVCTPKSPSPFLSVNHNILQYNEKYDFLNVARSGHVWMVESGQQRDSICLSYRWVKQKQMGLVRSRLLLDLCAFTVLVK